MGVTWNAFTKNSHARLDEIRTGNKQSCLERRKFVHSLNLSRCKAAGNVLGAQRCQSPMSCAMSIFSASLIADGVREKRGAGAGWVTP
jgi:hypothetical protein